MLKVSIILSRLYVWNPVQIKIAVLDSVFLKISSPATSQDKTFTIQKPVKSKKYVFISYKQV